MKSDADLEKFLFIRDRAGADLEVTRRRFKMLDAILIYKNNFLNQKYDCLKNVSLEYPLQLLNVKFYNSYSQARYTRVKTAQKTALALPFQYEFYFSLVTA
jgi:hypothetical protein